MLINYLSAFSRLPPSRLVLRSFFHINFIFLFGSSRTSQKYNSQIVSMSSPNQLSAGTTTLSRTPAQAQKQDTLELDSYPSLDTSHNHLHIIY